MEFPGVDPSWSRKIAVIDSAGISRSWHVLERPAAAPIGTMLCLHGNPTWSFLWRRVLAAAPPGWRVIAPDQLGMGWSDRLTEPRSLSDRIEDLDRLTEALEISGPVIVVAHDWGGLISLGWAERHRDLLAGIVLTNTGVAWPAGDGPPTILKPGRSRALRQAICVRTPGFLQATLGLSKPALPAEIRQAYAAPYASARRRQSIGDFVADIPFEAGHPSKAAMNGVATGLADLSEIPVLLAWGPRDPVFSIRYLHDLRRRLPQADVQLYPAASHLVGEDAPSLAPDLWSWVQTVAMPDVGRRRPDLGPPPGATDPEPAAAPANDQASRPLWSGLTDRATDPAIAVTELGPNAAQPISFAQLDERVESLTRGLVAIGVKPGHRVAMLVRPGIELTVAIYACWRAGAAVILADAGLGLANLGRALRSADPDHVIAIPAALALARALRIPGTKIVAGTIAGVRRKALNADHSLAELEQAGRRGGLPSPLDQHSQVSSPAVRDDAEVAVFFTSGATGPAKGVVYRQHQLRAQLAHVREVMRLGPDARFVAAFAPFALYAPALGAAAAVPDMDVTKPGTLTAVKLAEAVAAISATVVFASPAALRNIAATAGQLTAELRGRLAEVRTVLSAGAPVPRQLLHEIQTLMPNAELHTPYGMTEALPVSDITLAGIDEAVTGVAGAVNGVCVGRPLAGVRVALDPLDHSGQPSGSLTEESGLTGEICVQSSHVKDRYDGLWVTQQRSANPPGWHRTGDVGHLDRDGRLWVEGRLVHVISSLNGPVTPVGIEQQVEALPGISQAAAVGVGPAGTQQLVLVVVGVHPVRRGLGPLAPSGLAATVRRAAGGSVAAVLITDRLPVDIRHASKLDRARIARWAEQVLAGGSDRPGKRP